MASAGPLYELGIEYTDSLVRQLEGTPASDFASEAAGNDALKLRLRDFSLLRLEQKLDQIIERFEADDYKQRYEFLDYFKPVHRGDSETQTALNAGLTSALWHNGYNSVDFAVPDILEPLTINHYELRYGRESLKIHELDRHQIRKAALTWGAADPLREISVVALDSSGSELVRPYPLFYYIVAELEHQDGKFSLSSGRWYSVGKTYLDQVNYRLENVADLTEVLDLNDWRRGEDEGSYNYRVSNERGWLLLDKRNYSFGANRRIEICDLLTPERHLICVKRMTKSSALSHLFAQGAVSGELLVSDLAEYSDAVLKSLQSLTPDANFGTRSDWTIVFAIATDRPGRLQDNLFFFSKLNLDRAVRVLKGRGLGVAVARIPLSRH